MEEFGLPDHLFMFCQHLMLVQFNCVKIENILIIKKSHVKTSLITVIRRISEIDLNIEDSFMFWLSRFQGN